MHGEDSDGVDYSRVYGHIAKENNRISITPSKLAIHGSTRTKCGSRS